MYILSLSENILLFISGLGILQGFLLSLLLYYHAKSDRSVNKFLALYIVALSLVMAGPIGFLLFSWHSSFIFQPFPVAVGPLLYLYIRSYKENITVKKAFPHLLAFFLFFIVAYLRMQHLEKKFPGIATLPVEEFTTPFAILFSCFPYLHLVAYYLLSRRQLISYQKSIRHLFSETSRIDLRWVNWLINGYLAIIIIAFVLYLLMMKYPQHFTVFYLITMAIATPYIYITTYKGITQPTIWQVKLELDKKIIEEQIHDIEETQVHQLANGKSKTVKQGLGDARIAEINNAINALMNDEKLYQETELTLNDLSVKLNFPSHQVSQAINEGMNKNFYDLVNGYRVEEAKRLLLDSKNRNFTVLSVGFEAGFNSKTTFNTVFKKFTGLTPTEFREQHRIAAMA